MIPATDLTEYQVELVERVSRSVGHTRLRVSGPAGVGKTTALTHAIKEFLLSDGHGRVLILSTAVEQLVEWDRLLEMAEIVSQRVDGSRYRQLELEVEPDLSPWAGVETAVSAVQFLDDPNRADEVLAVEWSLVVIDLGSHELADLGPAGGVLRRLWDSQQVERAVAVRDAGSPIDLPGESLDWRGSRIAPQRAVVPIRVAVEFSDAELVVVARLRDLELELVSATGDVEPAVLRILRARASSSLAALYETLQRMRNRMVHGFNESTQEALPFSPGVLKAVQGVIDAFEDVAHDSKVEEWLQVITTIREGAGAPIITFTRFAFTADYLAAEAADRGLPVETVVGSASPLDRAQRIDGQGSGDLVLVTDAGIRGFELQPSDSVVHYDLPSASAGVAWRGSRLRPLSGGHVDHFVLMDPLAAPDTEALLQHMASL